MGSSISVPLFEFLNEILVIFGIGVCGITYFCFKCKAFFFAVTGCSCLYLLLNGDEQIVVNKDQVIFITGCDTGLGYSLVEHLCNKGFTVFAGFLNDRSDGANQLKKICGRRLIPLELDVTKNVMITHAAKIVKEYLAALPNARLHAVISNAGVMIFGEFEWLTEKQIHQQINVNFVGSVQVSQAFLPLLRKHSGRLIVIGSHCAFATLPGLGIYGATKAALHGWADSLRVEMEKYGVHVIKFVPGSQIMNTNIMARLKEHKKMMFSNFTPEQHAFYDDYFNRYFGYLNMIPVPKSVSKIDDDELYSKFDDAILNKKPSSMYVHEPFKYKFYHFLFKFSPDWLRDYFILKFITMPQWKPKSDCISIFKK